MSKGKVKIEITNTYFFTHEQWNNHDMERSQMDAPINEYLENVCWPQHTSTSIDMSEIEIEDEGKKDMLLG